MIEMTTAPIRPEELRQALFDPAAGAYCGFEGWIRNHNEGHDVLRLEYEAYEPLAITEGEKILAEARERYPHLKAHCVHRTGMLEIGGPVIAGVLPVEDLLDQVPGLVHGGGGKPPEGEVDWDVWLGPCPWRP